MNAIDANINRQMVEHIAQDLRAEVHRVPEDVARLMRSAAIVCDSYAQLRAAVSTMLDAEPQSAPFPPPQEQSNAQSQ